MKAPILKIKTKLPDFKLIEKSHFKAYHMPIHTLPLFDAAVLYKAGGDSDTLELAGVTSLMVGMLKKGTINRTVHQIDFELESLGLDLHIQTQSNHIFIQLDGLNECFHKGMEILSDVLKHPSFPEEEFDKLKEKKIFLIKRRLDDPTFLAFKAHMQELFNLKEFGFPVAGTIESLKRIQLQHIKERYEALIQSIPPNIFFVGALEEDEVRRTESFLKFETLSNDVSLEFSAPHKHENHFKIIVVHKPDSSQVQIRAGVHVIPHHHNDFHKLLLGASVLGGNFSSRLMQEIRVKRGFSYGAYSNVQALDHHHSVFTFQTYTRPENLQDVLDIFFNELQRLKTERIPDDELTMTKNYISGQYPLSFEQVQDLTSKLLKIELFHFTVDEIENFPLKLLDIQPEQIRDAFIKHIPDDAFTIVLVGNRDDILKHLKKEWKSAAIVKEGMDIINPKPGSE